MHRVLPTLTGLLLAACVAYIAGWYLGAIEGNMALLLTVAALVTGAYWVAEKLYFLPQRRKAAATFAQSQAQKDADMAAQGIAGDAVDVAAVQAQLLAQPWWLDWTAGMFPVVLVVFLLRSFAYEPFRIPSSSMLPTLEAGDMILVNKYVWGLRLPVVNTAITTGQAVQRGDVMVFHYPPNPDVDYIKRVVGLPGDTVSYIDKRLSINGQEIAYTDQPDYLGERESQDTISGKPTVQFAYFQEYREQLGARNHRVIVDASRPAGLPFQPSFAGSEHCHYSLEGVTCKVPDGHYFVMGDNRDFSADSRYWGFVPEGNIVGKAVAIWMNIGDIQRIGAIE